MTAGQITELVTEMRADLQIPPYFPELTLQRAVERGVEFLQSLNPVVDLSEDLTGRGLLGSYVLYDINHRTEEFQHNYSWDILRWQMLTPAPTEEEATQDEP